MSLDDAFSRKLFSFVDFLQSRSIQNSDKYAVDVSEAHNLRIFSTVVVSFCDSEPSFIVKPCVHDAMHQKPHRSFRLERDDISRVHFLGCLRRKLKSVRILIEERVHTFCIRVPREHQSRYVNDCLVIQNMDSFFVDVVRRGHDVCRVLHVHAERKRSDRERAFTQAQNLSRTDLG